MIFEHVYIEDYTVQRDDEIVHVDGYKVQRLDQMEYVVTGEEFVAEITSKPGYTKVTGDRVYEACELIEAWVENGVEESDCFVVKAVSKHDPQPYTLRMDVFDLPRKEKRRKRRLSSESNAVAPPPAKPTPEPVKLEGF